MKKHPGQLQKRFDQKERLKYLFFWGHIEPVPGCITKACLSQWYPSRFTVEDVIYHSAEQFMMAQKALLFDDKVCYVKIMEASHPNACKTLGRTITHFNESVWDAHKYEIVCRGNVEKFSQDDRLKAFLLQTGNRILAEASLYDRIWGIGMAATDFRCRNPHLWNGQNLLGFALMEVRSRLQLGSMHKNSIT